jgi:hypothetical protein
MTQGPRGGGGVRSSLVLYLIRPLEAGGWSKPNTGRFTPGLETRYPLQDVGWALGPIRTGMGNLAHTGVRIPELRTRSEPVTDSRRTF